MPELPTGTVTFLFTDIEGSTPLAQQYPAELPALLARHHAILHQSIAAHHGHVFQIIGDAFSAAFHTASDALHAALDAQRGLQHEVWHPAPIKARMGLHTGPAQAGAVEAVAGGYAGYATLARTQRVMSVAYGDQILLSNATAELLRDQLPAEVTLRDMNEHRLKGLAQPEHLWQLVAPGLATEFPPLKSLTTMPNNLPLQLTSFVGREKEIADIKGLLTSARLVTLTGSGGTGKTRLSIEVGTQLLSNFPNGVWLIELAPLSDPAQIIPAVAQAFGLQETPFNSLANLVADYLRDKKTLLILDNCEHLIAACARLADELLRQCAGLKILTSSREALGIAGEVAYRTPSLADSESISLFVDRARAANSKFALTDSSASAVAQICHRLDGIPLAIELAAARTRLLSADQIAARLDDLFRLLVGGSRTALPRQQTLRSLIDWSYDLLSEEEKNLLRIVSVFVGGWTLEALEAMSEDALALEHLEGLVNKSLVVTEEHKSEMRYFLLETIRQYAREKLFEAKQSSAARDRHFAYFNARSEKFWGLFQTVDDAALFDQLGEDIENFRTALEWGLENHVEAAVHLAANFCLILRWQGKPAEGVALAQAAVEHARALPPVEGAAQTQRQRLIARALFAQGDATVALGNSVQAIQLTKEAIAISRQTADQQFLGYSLLQYASSYGFAYSPDAEACAQEALDIFTHAIYNQNGLNKAYACLANIATTNGQETEKQHYLEKLKESVNAATASVELAPYLLSIGIVEIGHGHYQAAQQFFDEWRHIFDHMPDAGFQQALHSELGHLARHTGRLAEAKTIYRETIRRWKDLGNRGAIANQLECYAFIAILEAQPPRAAQLLGAAQALRGQAQAAMSDSERVEYDQSVGQLRTMLPEAEFNVLWAEGKSMTIEQAIEYALEKSDG